MKKIIGFFAVAVIATMVFLGSNVVNKSSSDTSLASLMNLNFSQANAEESDGGTTYLKEIRGTAVYGTVYTITGSAEFLVEVPVGATVTGTYYNHLQGTQYNCEWAFASCDQSKVRFEKI